MTAVSEPAHGIKVLFASAEVVPFAKTGGLGDVAGALPRALAQLGHRPAVITPLYRCTRLGKVPIRATEHTVTIPIGERSVTGRLCRATLPDSDVPVYLLEQPDFFERDDPSQGRGLYHYTLPSGQVRDYPDNSERFIFFSRAILELLPVLDEWPTLIHANDWQTGLVPVYLKEMFQPTGDERYQPMRVPFTIHNLAYQGLFWHWDMKLTGLDWQLFNHQQLEFFGHLNMLKAGIVFADAITTVSPRYAMEIQTPYFGCGLEGVLTERRDRLMGIVNGIDPRVWNPATDPYLAARYDADTVSKGKPICKQALQKRFSLNESARTPLLGIVSRLVDQKGIDLVCKAGDALMNRDVQLVVLGEGDPVYHRLLLELRERYPGKIGVVLGFDEGLAHVVEAGADVFLMPSLYEPSGLNQLYSLRYGTVPVVRATGGLADTIVDVTPETLSTGTATGFTFVPHQPGALLDTVQRAVDMYRQQPDKWLALVQTGMRQDWSWERSAKEYEELYQRILH